MNVEMKDGRVLSGTELEIVQQMKSLAFGQEASSMREYVAFVVDQSLRFENMTLLVSGESDDELATSLVAQMEDAGLLRRAT